MPKKRAKRIKLSDQIRQAIDTCGLSRNRVCKGTGIDKATISRFMSGERGLPTPALDRLADFLGLNITMEGPPTKHRGN